MNWTEKPDAWVQIVDKGQEWFFPIWKTRQTSMPIVGMPAALASAELKVIDKEPCETCKGSALVPHTDSRGVIGRTPCTACGGLGLKKK